MLTEADKKWLEERKDKRGYNFYYCRLCNKIPSIVTGGLCAGPCPMYPGGFEYEDAAEFEARVVAKLARGVTYGELPCGADPDCPDKNMDKYNTKETPLLGCQMCVLRAARLAVETELP